MSAESNIILITNDSGIVPILKPKLILLREVDNLAVNDYSSALENIKLIVPTQFYSTVRAKKKSA